MQDEAAALLNTGRQVLLAEAGAVNALAAQLGEAFAQACRLILDCEGRVIITGMGKSGHIGQKIAASFTSTGTAAHFLHPAEGVHGDLGVLHRKDLLLAISFSGETEEILDLLSPVRHLGIPLIAITGNPASTLASQATVALLLGAAQEADRYNLIPTTSTTLTLALGDALTVALMEARGFTPADFAVLHPKGALGKRLTLQVKELLRGEETNPVVGITERFGAALEVITRYTLGGASIVDESGRLAGIITDGDVRRIMGRFAERGGTVAEVMETPVAELMTKSPTFVNESMLAYDAIQLMENHQPRPVFIIPVVNDSHQPVGMLHLHALVQAGFKVKQRGE